VYWGIEQEAEIVNLGCSVVGLRMRSHKPT